MEAKILSLLYLFCQINAIDFLYLNLNLMKRNQGFETLEYIYSYMFLNHYTSTYISFSHSKLYSQIND